MAYSDVVLADTPLAYYRLGEASGTTMTDSSVNGRHGAYVGTPALGAAGLLVADANTSVDLDGTDDHGSVPDAAWMDVSSFTAEVVFRADTVAGDRGLLTHSDWYSSNFDTAVGRSWHLIIQGGQINVGLNFNDATFHEGKVGPTLTAGTTYHVALTWDGTIGRLYVDGAEVWNSGSTYAGKTLRLASVPLRVGSASNTVGPTGFFDGRLDEAAFYGSALSPARILAHHSASKATDVVNVLLQDNFDRADSATVVGSPQVGGPWVASGGSWGISSGQLYLSTVAVATLLAPGSANVDFSFTAVSGMGSSSGPHSAGVIRAADASNAIIMARTGSGDFVMQQLTGGTPTNVTESTTLAPNDTVRLLAYEEHVWVHVNGVRRLYFMDPKYDPASRNKIGLRNGGSSVGARWDNVAASTVISHPFGWPANAQADDIELSLADAGIAYAPSLYKGRDTALQDESEIP